MKTLKLHHGTEDYSSILETLDECNRIHHLEDQIIVLTKNNAQQLAYIKLLEPRALAFDKLNTDDLTFLNYDYARTVISLSEAIEKNILELMETSGIGNEYGKELSQILTFAEGIQKTVHPEHFERLQYFLSEINLYKLKQ